MHNDEIKQALVTLVMAAYDNGIVTRQEVQEFDPEYEATLRQNDQWAAASWGDWDRTPAPASPVTEPKSDEPTGVRYNGQTYPLDEAVAYAESQGYVKPDYMTWSAAAQYLRNIGHDVRLDYGTTTMTMVTEDDEDFGWLDEDEPEVTFPEDEGTIIAIGHRGAIYHPDCAVEEAINQGEASPAARGMTLADLYSQIGHNLLGEVTVHTTGTRLEWSECDHCGEDFTTATQPTATEDNSITFGMPTVNVVAAPDKSGFFRRIFGS